MTSMNAPRYFGVRIHARALRTAPIGLLAAVCLMTLAATAAADEITPSDRVKSRLNVRAQPPRGAVVASLRHGDRADLIDTENGWHQVRLDDGTIGFVSEGWTNVIPSPVAVAVAVAIPAEAVPLDEVRRSPGFTASMRTFFRNLFGRGPDLDLVISEPRGDGAVYRHLDPSLPVSGFATPHNTGRAYDVVLVLDASASTNEHAQTDVDRDGVREDDWLSDDSVFRAQLAAAMSFVKTLRTLPHNGVGQRIRVGVITCAGEDRYRLAPADADLDITLETVRWLAHRDATVVVPLTSDYTETERKLEELWSENPSGMTDIAAGIGRAVIELSGDTLRGAVSEARPDAEPLILFLTDGRPRLPYDRDTAERAAAYAGKLASEYGIRINAFELGKNPVTRERNFSLRRMAQRTGGRFVALDRPGDVVGVLPITSFSLLDGVRVRNHSTGHESARLATAIDGSFYAEVPLLKGVNDLEVEARLDNGKSRSERFHVSYIQGTPTVELERQLADLRKENAALVAQVRNELIAESEQERLRREQQRFLELRVEPIAVSAGPPPQGR